MIDLIYEKQQSLNQHMVYNRLSDLPFLRHFMEHHVYAVWDFMSLLKSLQKTLTCVQVPWVESLYSPTLVRLINEIVLGEESDLDHLGRPCSHFSLYLQAMDEVGANTQGIRNFISRRDLHVLPTSVREFVQFTLALAQEGGVEEVAASFFFGREKLIPGMFQSILQILESNNMQAQALIYYLKRHIDVDQGDHGPKSLECLEILCGSDQAKWDRAHRSALHSLELRARLWDGVCSSW